MNEYKSENGVTKLILNGWFMWFPENFPPSEDILPLFVSFHIVPSIAERLLTPITIEYLKKYGPIGCRDHYTRDLLLSKGVPAYYSSCLTLTLGKKYPHVFDDKEDRFLCKIRNEHIFYSEIDGLLFIPLEYLR